MRTKIRTLFISDVHLGNKKSNPDQLLEVFKKYDFDKLIIIGDFIDLTSLKRKFYWEEDHSLVIQKILRMSRKDVDITYILGNHDYYLRSLIEDGSITLGSIDICDEIVYTTLRGERIYICHGDQFDGFIRMHKFLYILGDWAYEFSFRINTIYNWFRRIFGKNYWSLSSYLKSKVKNAVMFVNDFKVLSVKKAKESECDSIMIGHIHTPAIELIEDITYYNTGDFCETCSYITENEDGELSLHFSKNI